MRDPVVMRHPHPPQHPAAAFELAAFFALLATIWGVVIAAYAVQTGWLR